MQWFKSILHRSFVFSPQIMMKVCGAAMMAGAMAWDLPDDCRNQTMMELGGVLPTMSYHIHYTTDKTSAHAEMKTFYEGFVSQFSDKFASDKQCPFGPNYGAYSSDIFPSQTICSLEGALEFDILGAMVDVQGNPWGSLYQRAFFVPIEMIDEAWEWSKANRGSLDIVKHPNSVACMMIMASAGFGRALSTPLQHWNFHAMFLPLDVKTTITLDHLHVDVLAPWQAMHQRTLARTVS